MRETDREMLIRIEGKIDLLNADNRRTAADIVDIRTRLGGHSERLSTLERDKARQAGIVIAVRLMWGVGGAIVASAGAVLARHWGI